MSAHPHFDIFDTESEAANALNYINTTIGYPINGIRNGVVVPNAAITWAFKFQRETDGKWAFSSLTQEMIDEFPNEFGSYYDTNYPHTVEDYHDDWGPVPDRSDLTSIS